MNNFQDSNSVLDLMFLYVGLEEFNNHLISPDIQSPSDYALLSISIIIKEEFIQEKKQSIVRNSDKEKEIINKLRNRIGSMEITHIINCEMLEHITQEFAIITEDLWNKFLKLVNITKQSKVW